MKTNAIAAGLFAAALSLPVWAQDYTVGALTIEHPYAFATPPVAPVAGGYLTVTNAGDTDDTLIEVRAAPEFAGLVQLHEMSMSDGVMRMQQIEGGIPIPAGEAVTLERGGIHVMFMRLPAGLEEGAAIPATLVFEQAGEVEIVFTVEARGGMGAGHDAHGEGHGAAQSGHGAAHSE